jgi:hypothetical protein
LFHLFLSFSISLFNTLICVEFWKLSLWTGRSRSESVHWTAHLSSQHYGWPSVWYISQYSSNCITFDSHW